LGPQLPASGHEQAHSHFPFTQESAAVQPDGHAPHAFAPHALDVVPHETNRAAPSERSNSRIAPS
jgi:hypothetical protein